MPHRLYILLLVPTLAACAAVTTLTAPTPTPMVFQPTLGRALSFLARQYDAAPGLLHASPVQSDVYWLTPDNLLVEWALQTANADEMSIDLATTLHDFEIQGNGLIEVLDGAVVTWPPAVAAQQEVSPTVWLESYIGAGVIDDWASRADLTLFAALNAWNQGEAAQAQEHFTAALAMFDGAGFPDVANPDRYATADLALALIAGARLGAPVNDAIVRRLLSLQGDDGGFAVHYTADGPVDGADTRTTAYALLALYALRQPSQ